MRKLLLWVSVCYLMDTQMCYNFWITKIDFHFFQKFELSYFHFLVLYISVYLSFFVCWPLYYYVFSNRRVWMSFCYFSYAFFNDTEEGQSIKEYLLHAIYKMPSSLILLLPKKTLVFKILTGDELVLRYFFSKWREKADSNFFSFIFIGINWI